MERKRTYICIDLKSFYASVECRERHLDPMTSKLVVADPERTDQTICLAVSPALKALGIPGRCRVFEIPPGIEYIMAPPRMQLYIDYSAKIYSIYLKYISAEDIHVYSIDEVFMDVTEYLTMYSMSSRCLASMIMKDILDTTGIPSAAGIGTNLYLAKIALDLTAKHSADHIGILDENSYCRNLWKYRPLTDFWRIGKGIANRLARLGISTMGDIARADESMLYRQFGIDAELLIDHAWGREPTGIADIKAYRPKSNSLSSGQVLPTDYTFDKARLAVKEMADLLSLELAGRQMVTDSVTLHAGYSGRFDKKPAHGTEHMGTPTNSSRRIIERTAALYDRIVDPHTSLRRITITFNHVTDNAFEQYDLFTDPAASERERHLQKALLDIKEKFGKNSIVRGMDLLEGATTIDRNRQIGGHKSGV